MAKTTTDETDAKQAKDEDEGEFADTSATTPPGNAKKRNATKDDQLPTSGATHYFEASTATWVASDAKQSADHKKTVTDMAAGMDAVAKDEL